MSRRLAVVAASLLLLVGSPLCARAADGPAVDVSGGYAFSRVTNGPGTNFPVGWFASMSASVTPTVAIAGDVTGAYRTESVTFSNAGLSLDIAGDERLYTYMVGPRIASRTGRTKVFGQFLVGGATLSVTATASGAGIASSSTTSETYVAFAPGGGVDVMASEHFAVRVFADFQLFKTSGDWAKVLVAGAGMVWTRN